MSQNFHQRSEIQAHAADATRSRGSLAPTRLEANIITPTSSYNARDREAKSSDAHAAQGQIFDRPIAMCLGNRTQDLKTHTVARDQAEQRSQPLRRKTRSSKLRYDFTRHRGDSPSSHNPNHTPTNTAQIPGMTTQDDITPSLLVTSPSPADDFLTDQEFQDRPTTHGPGSPYEAISSQSRNGADGQRVAQREEPTNLRIMAPEPPTSMIYIDDTPQPLTTQGDGSRYPLFRPTDNRVIADASSASVASTPSNEGHIMSAANDKSAEIDRGLVDTELVDSARATGMVVSAPDSPVMQSHYRGHDLHFSTSGSYETTAIEESFVARSSSVCESPHAQMQAFPVEKGSQASQAAYGAHSIEDVAAEEEQCSLDDDVSRFQAETGRNLLLLSCRNAIMRSRVDGFLRRTENLVLSDWFEVEMLAILQTFYRMYGLGPSEE